MSIYSKSLRVLTIFRCLIFKVLFRSFFPFLSAFLPLSVSLFSCRPERNSCYYIALHPFCQHFFWIFLIFFHFYFSPYILWFINITNTRYFRLSLLFDTSCQKNLFSLQKKFWIFLKNIFCFLKKSSFYFIIECFLIL